MFKPEGGMCCKRIRVIQHMIQWKTFLGNHPEIEGRFARVIGCIPGFYG